MSMDDYLKPDAFFKSQGIDPLTQAKDPRGIDFEKLRHDLERLNCGKDVVLQTRDRLKADYRGKEKYISGKDLEILIVEGLSALLPNQPSIPTVSNLFDLKIYLHISPEDAEKGMFNKIDQQRALGLSSLSDTQIYDRFRSVDLPRFKSHYPLCRSGAEIIAEFNIWSGQFILSSLIFSEDVLCRILM
jgi:pantothenate kinase